MRCSGTKALLARAALGASLLASPAAWAAPPEAAAKPAAAATSVRILPAMVAEGDALRRPSGAGELANLAASLDAQLAETAQDLGLAVDRRHGAPVDPARLGEADLLERARLAGGLVVLPSLRALVPGEVELRLALADPAARALVVRRERVIAADLPVRAVVMLRDLVAKRGDKPAERGGSIPDEPPPKSTAGRITLVANSTLYGGLVGFSIQRASGSSDPRLLYPLIAVGAGIGLGASLVASGEWSVTSADAWFIASGAWWPTAAAHLIYQGRFHVYGIESDRWVFGLIGGTAGVTLASLGAAVRPISDGGALIAHSGGALGMFFGGLVEAASRGDLEQVPFSGMGYGAGLGWLAAATFAIHVRPPPSRVLAFDLGAVLGGLAGAAIGSPLLLDSPDAGHQRAWVGAVGGGALAGAGVSLLITRSWGKAEKSSDLRGTPTIGVLGESALGPLRAPILGVGWSGVID